MKTILLVDDDDSILDLLRLTFEGGPYRVLEARDGEKAMQMIWQEPIDVVLVDWMLPGLAGIHVQRALTGRLNAPKTIMLSAKTRERDVVRATSAGVQHYITKPFSPAEVRAKVEEVLA